MLPKTHPQSRYEIVAKIASGGMATVYLGVLKGPFDFEHFVAIKRLHPHLLDEPSVRQSLVTEARLAARIRHANVVDVRDVEMTDDTIQLVMPYIEGASLGSLAVTATQYKAKVPPAVAIRIVLDACAGLHAAHELKDGAGKPFGLVHRDISPQNILVGIDGIARITDFGIARYDSSDRLRTNTGMLKGKFSYMAPEYIHGQRPDRRIDVFALGVVLWETLAGRRLFRGSNDAETISRVTSMEVPPIGDLLPELGDGIDAVLEMALSKKPEMRFRTAQAFGAALEGVAKDVDMIAPPAEVSRYVRLVAREELTRVEEMRLAATRDWQAMKRDNAPNKAIEHVPTPPWHHEVTDKTRIVPEMAQLSGARKVAPSLMDEMAAGPSDAPSNAIAQEPSADKCIDPSANHPDVAQAGTGDDAAPAPSFPPTLRRPYGPRGTAVMAPAPNVQVVVANRSPLPNDGALAAPGSGQDLPPKAAAPSRSHVGIETLPVSLEHKSLPVLPFKTEKSMAKRTARKRWIVAACMLFILSGIGTTLLMVPRSGAREVQRNASGSNAE